MVSEDKLIDGCKKKKSKYQLMLFDEYSPMLKSLCFRYVNNDSDAEEVLQQGFIKIFDKIDQFKKQGSFVFWMRRIVINTAINYCKKNKSLRYSEWNDNLNQISDDQTSEDLLIEKESEFNKNPLSEEALSALIEELPNGCKTIFKLYVIESFSHKQIADELEISVGTSKSQLSIARKKLAQKVKFIIKEAELNEK